MSGKFTYKVVEESKEDPIFNIIEKGNVTVRFSLDEVQRNIDQNKKLVKELKAKLDLEEAKRKNIEEHHPFVKALTPEQRFTVHMYAEAMSVVDSFPAKIKEFEDSIAEMEKEKEAINEACGIAIPKAAVAAEHAEPKEKPEKAVDL